MKAVVLIGGKGTSLRPTTYTVFKAMVPLRNKPYIHYLVSALKRAELGGAILSMGYLPDPIGRCFAEHRLDGSSLKSAVEGRLLGTGGQ